MTLINNKMKQAIGGNWGKPQLSQQHIKLRDLVLEPARLPNKKKKHEKIRQKRVFKGYCCPFCHAELPLDENLISKMKKESPRESYGIWKENYRMKICPECGASEIKECPACKHETWHRQGWYKHAFLGCGFNGKKKDL